MDLVVGFEFKMVSRFEYRFGVVVDFEFEWWLGLNLGLGLN